MMQQPTPPFQGQADLVVPTTRLMNRVTLIGACFVSAVLGLLYALSALVPSPSESLRSTVGVGFELCAAAFTGGYLYMLSKAMRTRTEPVEVHADGRGLSLNHALVAPREAVRFAAIRLPREAAEHVVRRGVISVDASPLTVEIATDDAAWNIALGDMHRSAALLAAMGFPPATVPADQQRPLTRAELSASRPGRVAIALVVGGSIVATLWNVIFPTLRR